MSLRDRLDRLEKRHQRSSAQEDTGRRAEVELYFKHMENARRELHGLEPEPLTPEEERIEYESNKAFLEETLPEYRRSRGWRSETAQAALDRMEQHAREKISEYERSRT